MQQTTSNDLKNFNIHDFMDEIKNKMPFYNERHFQCELGSAIKMFFLKNKNIEVLYEMYYPTNNYSETAIMSESNQNVKAITKIKRNYTDIVICDKNTEEYISIELKYALSDRARNKSARFEYTLGNGDKITIAKKGALDNCRYDYLFDVYRLEQLKETKFSCYEHKNLKKFVAGYAIILSNDKSMWEEIKLKGKDKPYYRNFRLNNETSGVYSWTGGKNTKPNAIRPNITGLTNKYRCNWMPQDSFYFEDKGKSSSAPAFKYLIVEIKK